jgi:hypothetical protein
MNPMARRARATALHLLISGIFASIAAGISFIVWYPSPLWDAVGLVKIFFLLIGIDVVIGPCLTFLVYKVGKPSLKFDIGIIVALQLAAFGYGFFQIAQARPAWIVFNMDRFDVVQAMDLDERRKAEANPNYSKAPWLGPKIIASQNPTDTEKHTELMFESAQGGPDLPQRIDLYVPLEAEASAIRSKAQDFSQLGEFNSKIAIDAVLKQWPQADGWLPINAKAKSMTALIEKKNARLVAIVDLRPWKDD